MSASELSLRKAGWDKIYDLDVTHLVHVHAIDHILRFIDCSTSLSRGSGVAGFPIIFHENTAKPVTVTLNQDSSLFTEVYCVITNVGVPLISDAPGSERPLTASCNVSKGAFHQRPSNTYGFTSPL